MSAKTNLTAWDVSTQDFPADGSADEKWVFMLNYAILAPSSHNTQPWLFRTNGHALEVLADARRALPVVDPDQRELVMSCGAAIHHLCVAARYFNHSVRVDVLPDPGEPELLARLSLGGQSEASPEEMLLFSAIQKRHTNRLPFAPDPIPEALLENLHDAARAYGCALYFFSDDESRFRIGDLVASADRQQWQDREFRRELAEWLTPNSSPRRDGIPGYAHGRGDLASQAEPLLVRTFDLGKGQAARDRDIALYSPLLVLLTTTDDSRVDWIQAGQALSAILLRARMEDVWASFLNQAIEIPHTREALGQLTGQPEHPQILLRLGFGPQVAPTPRRSVNQVLLEPNGAPIRLH